MKKTRNCTFLTLILPLISHCAMTEKEIMLEQRKVEEKELKEFKKQLKEWILNEIPQD